MLENFSITPTSTAEQIAQALQDAIVRGELVPGQRLRESALATRLGVSRNTVRESVRILGQGGLVRHETNRGAVVTPLVLDEVEDLYRVRELLELSALDAAGADSDLTRVEEALAELETAAYRGDIQETVERDLNLHATFVALLRSPRIDAFFADLRRQLRFYVAVLSVVDRETEHPHELVEQHAAVVRELQAGRPAAAKALLRRHIRANASRVTTVLRERESRAH